MRHTAGELFSVLASGHSAAQLARRLAVDIAEARSLLAEFDLLFPAVRTSLDRLCAEAQRHGWIANLGGRRRRIAADSPQATTRRLVAHHCFAGSAADAIKSLITAVATTREADAPLAAIIDHRVIVDCSDAREQAARLPTVEARLLPGFHARCEVLTSERGSDHTRPREVTTG